MIRVLLTGKLHGAPVSRTGSSGKPFTTAKLRAQASDNETQWASLIAFGDAADTLADQTDGAAIAVSGRATLKTFDGKHGETQIGIDVVVDQIASLKAKRKPKAQAVAASDDPFSDMDGCGDLGGIGGGDYGR